MAKKKVAAKKNVARKTKKVAGRKTKPRKKVNPISKGHHTVTPHLVLDDCAKAIAFYAKAFGAREMVRMPGPDGKIVHAEIKVGDSMIMMNDEMPPMAGQPGVYKSPKAAGFATAALFLYVRGVDAAFERAVKAGCTVRMPLMDMFWGDRFGQVIDPFGHTWSLATHIEDVRPSQMRKRQEEFFAQMQQRQGSTA
jgi:PhnB protein